jgi:DNA invertase Pin-like site-specific DNA recombinase
MNAKTIVAYYRVSTRQQARSGLGLQAQQDAIGRYVVANRCKVLAELTEVESGRNDGRPKLAEALWFCRVYGAKLVIARLDRLARSTAMITGLMKSGVDFVKADTPLANRFTIHILAAVAEYEARLISERIKAAFPAAKVRGRKFGNPDPAAHRFSDAARAAVRAVREQAKARALDYLPLFCQLRDRGETIHGIALQLMAMGIETPRRKLVWRDRTVARVFEYAGERKPKPWASRRTRDVRLSNIWISPGCRWRRFAAYPFATPGAERMMSRSHRLGC